MCVVRFYALGQPAFYDVDLVCEVHWNSQLISCYLDSVFVYSLSGSCVRALHRALRL